MNITHRMSVLDGWILWLIVMAFLCLSLSLSLFLFYDRMINYICGDEF